MGTYWNTAESCASCWLWPPFRSQLQPTACASSERDCWCSTGILTKPRVSFTRSRVGSFSSCRFCCCSACGVFFTGSWMAVRVKRTPTRTVRRIRRQNGVPLRLDGPSRTISISADVPAAVADGRLSPCSWPGAFVTAGAAVVISAIALGARRNRLHDYARHSRSSGQRGLSLAPVHGPGGRSGRGFVCRVLRLATGGRHATLAEELLARRWLVPDSIW